MTTNDEIRSRLYTIREYYRAEFAKRSLAAPAASELIWVLTGEEAMGDAYINGEYEIPIDDHDS